jgi:lipoate-protein ligase B
MGLVVHDLGRRPYAEVLALQERLVAEKHTETGDDYLLVLEHDPVFTLGRGADISDLQGAGERLGVPVFRVGRGGGVTFHGPGQLIAYPILTLRDERRDVRRYVRTLEAVLVAVCDEFSVPAARRDGFPGAWVGGAKIASIGVSVRRWITSHGVALNVATDLSFFNSIVPCRMPEVRMTSMAEELDVYPQMVDVKRAFVQQFSRAFELVPLVEQGRLCA